MDKGKETSLAGAGDTGSGTMPEGITSIDEWAFSGCGGLLSTIKNADDCLKWVRASWRELKYVPDSWKTPELCIAAVIQNEDALKYVPKELEDSCFWAAQFMLGLVPKALRTPELCLAAVKIGSENLKYVPRALRTPELCLSAVKGHCRPAEKFVWNARQAKKDGTVLRSVPKALRTAELCLAAVRTSGYALKYVPEALKTPELQAAAEASIKKWEMAG